MITAISQIANFEVKIHFKKGVKVMKERYESAEIELILVGGCDVITSSLGEDGPITDGGPIGGGGYDPDAWT